MEFDNEIFDLAKRMVERRRDNPEPDEVADKEQLYQLGSKLNQAGGLGEMARAFQRVGDRAEPDSSLAMDIEGVIDFCWAGIGQWGH